MIISPLTLDAVKFFVVICKIEKMHLHGWIVKWY